jgi:acyl-CoA thioester hydrolase
MIEFEAIVNVKVRFSDTDAMGVVWHGNYLKLFEDGREEFGNSFNMSYLEVYNHGFFTPIVKTEVEHKAPIYYGEEIQVIAKYIPSRAAKIVFEYKVKNVTTGKICAIGKTMQVFLDKESRELELFTPKFYSEWEASVGIKH